MIAAHSLSTTGRHHTSWDAAGDDFASVLSAFEREVFGRSILHVDGIVFTEDQSSGGRAISATVVTRFEELPGIGEGKTHRGRTMRAELVDDALLSRNTVEQFLINKATRFVELDGVDVMATSVAPTMTPPGRFVGIILIAIDEDRLAASATRCSSSSAMMSAIRFLSFNIWVGGGLSLASCVEVIRHSDADLICLQEATPLTVHLIASALGATVISSHRGILSFIEAEEVVFTNDQSALLRLDGEVEVYVSNIHLTAYPYAPHVAKYSGLEAAVESERSLQGKEIEAILRQNGYEPRIRQRQIRATKSVFEFDHSDADESSSVCSSDQNMSPTIDTAAGSPLADQDGASLASTPCMCQSPGFPRISDVFPAGPSTSKGPSIRPRRLEILCGDFNAPSHLDACWIAGVAPAVAVNWAASSACAAAGFTDAFRCRNEQPREECGAHVPFYSWSPMAHRERHGCFDRIDFVYCRRIGLDGELVAPEDLVEAAAHLDSTPSGKPWPSDHRAVLTTLTLR